MAKSTSTCNNRRFQSSFFSESEIEVAVQLIHLSEDSDNHDEISGCTSCSDGKSIASATSAKNDGGMEEVGISRSSHSGGTTTLIGEIFEGIGDGANRRRRKRRSRSVYEIYKLTKPVISVN